MIRECEKESFIYRSLPFGTVLGVAVYLGVQRGILKVFTRLSHYIEIENNFLKIFASPISEYNTIQFDSKTFQPNKKYGAVPKIVAASVVGYFTGKLSYQNVCAEKLMQLPDSKFGQLLKERRQAAKRGAFYENLTPDQGFGAGLALAPFHSATDLYTDEMHKVGIFVIFENHFP